MKTLEFRVLRDFSSSKYIKICIDFNVRWLCPRPLKTVLLFGFTRYSSERETMPYGRTQIQPSFFMFRGNLCLKLSYLGTGHLRISSETPGKMYCSSAAFKFLYSRTFLHMYIKKVILRTYMRKFTIIIRLVSLHQYNCLCGFIFEPNSFGFFNYSHSTLVI